MLRRIINEWYDISLIKKTLKTIQQEASNPENMVYQPNDVISYFKTW